MYEFESCPVSVEFIATAQEQDEDLQKIVRDGHPTKLSETKELGSKTVWAYFPKRGDEESLVFVPKNIREALTEWYHNTLKYPGAERLLATMILYFNWSGMKVIIEKCSKTCDICQRQKITGIKKYGKPP